MKKIVMLLGILSILVVFSGCEEKTAEQNSTFDNGNKTEASDTEDANTSEIDFSNYYGVYQCVKCIYAPPISDAVTVAAGLEPYAEMEISESMLRVYLAEEDPKHPDYSLDLRIPANYRSYSIERTEENNYGYSQNFYSSSLGSFADSFRELLNKGFETVKVYEDTEIYICGDEFYVNFGTGGVYLFEKK